MRLSVFCGNEELQFEIPDGSLAWELWPEEVPAVEDEEKATLEALANPIGCGRLGEMVSPGMEVVILVDDFTRPTPRKTILSLLLDELKAAGIEEASITVIVALGTHRYMTEEEIIDCVGDDNYSRVKVINHEWMDEENLVDLGTTESGTPVKINKIAYEADFLVAVGSIVPHFVGFSGGAKIIQPGISGADTTAGTHFLVCQEEDMTLHYAGTSKNKIIDEMREVARRSGLNFIVNVVFNTEKQPVQIVAGDMVEAHNAGMAKAGEIFIKEIDEKVDIVITEARPADADMWQSTKPFSYSRRTIPEGGTRIFISAAPDGIGNHPFIADEGRASYHEIKQMFLCGQVEDRVAGTILMIIRKSNQDVDTYMVSNGLTPEEKASMGLFHAETVQEAVDKALEKHGPKARIGVIHHGGDVLPVPPDMR